MNILTKKLAAIFFTVLINLLSTVSFAAGHDIWNLTKDQSSINFISIKKGSIGETHSFKDFSGILDHGKAAINIDVASVDMLVPIRSERAVKYLFEATQFSSINVKSDVTVAMKAVKEGETLFMNLPATLSLHGVTKEIMPNVSVTRNGKKTLTVSSVKPVIIRAADYNMDAGVAKLSNFVGDIPIATSVPVNFVLTLKKA